ncbi:19037_t:CDS:1, partial [Racocetra persica]
TDDDSTAQTDIFNNINFISQHQYQQLLSEQQINQKQQHESNNKQTQQQQTQHPKNKSIV